MIKITVKPEYAAKIPEPIKDKIEFLSIAITKKEVITFIDHSTSEVKAVFETESFSIELSSTPIDLKTANSALLERLTKEVLEKARQSLVALLTYKEVVKDIHVVPHSTDAAMALAVQMLSKIIKGNCGNPDCRSCNEKH